MPHTPHTQWVLKSQWWNSYLNRIPHSTNYFSNMECNREHFIRSISIFIHMINKFHLVWFRSVWFLWMCLYNAASIICVCLQCMWNENELFIIVDLKTDFKQSMTNTGRRRWKKNAAFHLKQTYKIHINASSCSLTPAISLLLSEHTINENWLSIQ